MKFKLHPATIGLLKGLKGIELGPAAHNPFGVDAINVGPDRPEDAVFRAAEKQFCGKVAGIDLIGHAADIPVEDESQGFVLSSHVLEHAPDLLAAFLEMDRVVRVGGYIVFIFPLPNALAGDDRPLSEVEAIWRAYEEGWTWETAPDDAAFGGVGGHYWKLDCPTMKTLIESLCRKNAKRRWPGVRWELVGEEDPDQKVGNGFWMAWKKRGSRVQNKTDEKR